MVPLTFGRMLKKVEQEGLSPEREFTRHAVKYGELLETQPDQQLSPLEHDCFMALLELYAEHDHEANGCKYVGLDMWDCGVLDGQAA